MRKYDYTESVTLKEYEQGDFGLEIPRRYDIEVPLTTYIRAFDWQATYKFSAKIRNNKLPGGTYGETNMTMRRLYVILCEKFNNGNYFIDDYFKHIYPSRMKPLADELLEKLKAGVMSEYKEMLSNMVFTKSGNLDRRYRRSLKRLSEFKALADESIKSEGEYIAGLVKEDIKICLATGIIPLSKKMLSKATVEQRVRLGLPAATIFYATGQLIDNIKVYFRLEKKEWIDQDF